MYCIVFCLGQSRVEMLNDPHSKCYINQKVQTCKLIYFIGVKCIVSLINYRPMPLYGLQVGKMNVDCLFKFVIDLM